MASTATQNDAPNHAVDDDETAIDVQIEQLRIAMNKMLDAGNSNGAIETLLQVIAHQHHDIVRLGKFVRAAQRARYGRSSEKLTDEELEQLALAFGATAEEAKQDEPKVPASAAPEEKHGDDESNATQKKKPKGGKKGKHPGRTKLAPNLPRNITFHPVPDDERTCIHCQAEMKSIGHTDYERVQYYPARIVVDVDRCEKVACQDCRQDIAAAARPGVQTQPNADQEASASEATESSTTGDTTPMDNSATAPGAHIYRRAGASLLAQLLEAKADDALPIYRQRQQLARLGFDVPLNTLYGYWDAAAKLVLPVAQIVLSEVLGHAIVGLDDTKLDWLDPKEGRQRKRGHLWCFMGTGPLVAFDFTETWRADDVAPWIEAIDGFIQCDDYKGYSALRAQPDGTKSPLVPPELRLGCWMHVRRRFHKAYKSGEKHAIIALGHIKELYDIEHEAKEHELDPSGRLALRQRRSQAVADEFFEWVSSQKNVVRPSSYTGEAVRYALDQKDFVLRCLTDGRFELDTGRVERQIREPVIGRKNYLFSGSAEAARRLAGVYTLVCSCQNLGINTRAYLVDIITRLEAGFPLRQINRLRPDVWAAENPALAAYQVGQQPAE